MATQGSSFRDQVALFRARLAVNGPQMSPTDNSIIAALAYPILSADADTGYLITSNAPNMSVTTATGAALDAIAANYGVNRNRGTASSATVVFKTASGANVAVNTTIPKGSVITTAGDGITTQQIAFTTSADTTITAGTSVSSTVTAVAAAPGVAGNVAQATIVNYTSQTGSGGLVPSNATIDGGTAATGGVDADSDAVLRQRTFAAQATKYGVSAIQLALLAVPGVYDAYVVDNGNGTITYNWADANGNQTLPVTGTPATAVTNVLPVGVTTSGVTTFTITTLTALAFSYSAPASVQSAAIEPIIEAAIVQYINGVLPAGATYITPQSGQIHGTVPTNFGIISAVLTAAPQLTQFILGSTTPIIGAASNTTLWRSGAVGSVTWTPTRV